MKKYLMKTIFYSTLFIFLLYVFVLTVIFTILLISCPIIIFESLKLLNELGLITIIGIISAMVIASFIYFRESEEGKKLEEKEQIKLIDSLLAELTIISSGLFDTYFDDDKTRGNLEWYECEIKNNNYSALDHKVNKLSFQQYITKLDSNICKKIEFQLI